MKNISLKEMLNRYILGQCTKEEALWVEKWYEEQEPHSSYPISQEDFQKDISEIYNRLVKKETKKVRIFKIIKTAAVFIGLCLVIGCWLYFKKDIECFPHPEVLLLTSEHGIEGHTVPMEGFSIGMACI